MPGFNQKTAWAIIIWSTCSACLVLSNKMVIHGLAFKHPLTLTLMHCAWVSLTLFVACDCLQLLPSVYRSRQAWNLWFRVLPVAALFAASTLMRNAAYAHLPVSMIQIVAGAGPALTYLASCVLGLEAFVPKLGGAVVIMFAGVFVATFQGALTSPFGLALQSGGVMLEVMRSVMLKRIFVDFADTGINFLGVLYLSAPLSMLMLAVPACMWDVGPAVGQMAQANSSLAAALGANVCLAVCVNFASYFFINACSNTTASVTAASKDSVLILGSLLVCQGLSPASLRSLLGYFVSLAGTGAYITFRAALVPVRPSKSNQDLRVDMKKAQLPGVLETDGWAAPVRHWLPQALSVRHSVHDDAHGFSMQHKTLHIDDTSRLDSISAGFPQHGAV